MISGIAIQQTLRSIFIDDGRRNYKDFEGRL